MDFSNPWDNIKIRALSHSEEIQYFDSRIHIVYVLFGEAVIKNQSSQLKLGKDDFLILSKTDKYDCQVKNDAKVFYFTLDYFAKNSNDNYVLAFRGDSINKPRAMDNDLVYQLRQLLLMKILKDKSNQSKVYKQYFTLITLLEDYYQVKLRSNHQKNIRGQIEDLKFYIDNNFEKDIRLSDLADQLYVTEQYLSRVFKEQNGMGVSEYLIRRRLAKVRQLLLESEDSITDIAYSAGFSNINSFNRIFKKYQGMTPSDYRLEIKNNLLVSSSGREKETINYDDIQEYLQENAVQSTDMSITFDPEKILEFEKDKLLINLGYAGDLLHTSLVKEIGFTNSYTSFRYGRIWGLLSDTILKQKGDYFDFSKVDEIVQNILDMNLIPFLDLGFKGKQIHQSVETIISREAFQLPSHDMVEILKRYRNLIQHFLDRYGYDEVAKWKIELWKPNTHVLETIAQEELALLKLNDNQLDLTKTEDYLTFFSLIKQEIQGIIPDLEVGGSGITLNLEKDSYKDFIQTWSVQKVKPDFITFTAYSLDILKQNFDNADSQALISSDSNFLKASLREAKHIIEQAQLCSKLIVSEFNLTNSSRDIINDSAFKGPYIIKNLLALLDICDLVGYWQFSDISFTSFDVNEKESFGGSGLISKSGIAKPSFYAFDFLNSLGNQLLYFSEGVVITKSRRKIVILLYHYCHLNSLYYYSGNEPFTAKNIASLFENDGNRKFQFKIPTDDDKRTYKMKTRRIGNSGGAFLTEAEKVSSNTNFNREEINYLKYRCIPSLKTDLIVSRDNLLEFRTELKPHDMVLIEIS